VLRPDLWQALFNEDTFVRPHSPDDISGAFQSYPAARLHDVVKDGYQDILQKSPVKPPSQLPSAFEDLVRLFIPASSGDEFDYTSAPSDDMSRARIGRDLFRPDDPGRSRAAVFDRLVDLALEEAARRRYDSRGGSVEIVPDTGDPESALSAFLLFHQQPTGTVLAPPATADDTRVDFHQHLAKLGEYPGLQRALGLVLDFNVGVTNIPQTASGAHGLLRAVPTFGTALVPSAGQPVNPPTAFTLTTDRFEAASDPALPRDAVRGVVNLALTIGSGSNEPQFRLLQLDVDSAAFKAIDLLTRAARGSLEPDASLGALRSSGVSIVRYGNGRFLMDAIGIGLQKICGAGRRPTNRSVISGTFAQPPAAQIWQRVSVQGQACGLGRGWAQLERSRCGARCARYVRSAEPGAARGECEDALSALRRRALSGRSAARRPGTWSIGGSNCVTQQPQCECARLHAAASRAPGVCGGQRAASAAAEDSSAARRGVWAVRCVDRNGCRPR
jgi:hypothetical protein